MGNCEFCKSIIFENGSRYCEYDGCICHDKYNDGDCNYFNSIKRSKITMNNNILYAIEKVINNRMNNGATIEGLQRYIKHLLTETYKNCPNLCGGIQNLAIKYKLNTL